MSAGLMLPDSKTAVAMAPAARILDQRALLAIGAIAATIIIFYHATVWSMIVLWWRSQTFAHGFVIVPISAWLIWRERERLASVPLRPNAGAFLLLAALGGAWLMAQAANVQVVMQYAVMAMIPVAVLAMLGWQVARAIAFPLAYLLLAVPFGEVFLAPLMDFTANFTVAALQLTGIPVFRENNIFSIPSGNWSVVEACSGLRYVIASLALGSLYAYLNYRSLPRRLMFIAVALILPIFANGVRAYLIVMIGHLSNMHLAVGVDHLIYGWLFFGLVSMLLFWAGSFWREAPLPAAPAVAVPTAPVRQLPTRRANLVTAIVAGVAICACWPLMAALLLGQQSGASTAALTIAAQSPWVAIASAPDDWRADHAGTPLMLEQSYRNSARALKLQVAWYQWQQKDAELLTPVDAVDQRFRALEERIRSVQLAGAPLTVRQSVLQSATTRLLVWRWYRQSGIDTADPFLVKFLLAKNKLLHLRQDGAEIIVSTPFDDKPAQAQAEALLQQFLVSMLPAIGQGLNHAAAN
jgi:exosortase A